MKIFRNTRWLLLAAALPAAANLGCGVTVNAVIPAASGLTAVAKPPDCHLDFFWTAPDRPYQELAAVSLITSFGRSDYADYQAALHVQACALGGDAVIVLFPFSSREGIVVKYRQAPAQGDGGSSQGVAKVRAREQAAGAAALPPQH
ncbi:MAG TPA: hypothetical protein VH853_19045 [Polyangia bacterium]|jgi:hypothetical protein|nr:hypothetical protein [Polyangia bacterium]